MVGLEVIAKAFAIWLILLVCAVLNGALREAVLIPKLGRAAGLLLSGALLSVAIVVVSYLALPWLGITSDRQLWLVGFGWLAATVIFEFVFGLSRGEPLSEILAAYSFKGGNLWPVVLAITAASPWLTARIRGW